MNSTVTLHLNETGSKALGQSTKIVYLDVMPDQVTHKEINKVFPMALVDNFEVSESFGNMNMHDTIGVRIEDKLYLGDCFRLEYRKGQVCMIGVQYQITPDNFDYNYSGFDYRYFHPNGLEMTHKKHKARLVRLSEEEIAELQRQLDNVNYINMISTLAEEGEGLTFEAAKLRRPKWLTEEGVKQILEILNTEMDAYDQEF